MKRRARLVERLDTMVAGGRVTEAEAVRIRAAGDFAEFDAAVGEVQLRHATPRLSAAVEEGKMTQAQADEAMEQVRAGEHPRSLRGHLRGLGTP